MKSEHYDVVVVGCGIIGSTTALSLSKASKKILIIEHNALPLRESTLAGFGALTPFSDPFFIGDTALFASKSLQKYKEEWLPWLFDNTGQNVPISDTGLIQLFTEKEKLDREVHRYSTDCIPGYRPDILDSKELNLREPAITLQTAGALYHPEPWIDLNLYKGSLEVAMTANPQIDLRLNCSIRELIVNNTGLKGTLSDGSKFSSDFLVVSTGLGSVDKPPIKNFTLRWIRGDGIAIRTPNNKPLFKNNIYFSPGFIAPRTTGEMLLGSTYVDEGCKEKGTPVPERDKISFGSLQYISSSCSAISTHLESCNTEKLWRGWRPCSSDEYPIFGPDPDNPNILYAQAFLGLGITLSVAVGDSITNYVSGKSSIFPREMSPGRFF